MRSGVWIIGMCLATAGGCSSNSSGEKSSDLQESEVPRAVVAAFQSEHPYAEMNHPKMRSTADGVSSYEIPYTRPDGTKGDATYGTMGELLKDE